MRRLLCLNNLKSKQLYSSAILFLNYQSLSHVLLGTDTLMNMELVILILPWVWCHIASKLTQSVCVQHFIGVSFPICKALCSSSPGLLNYLWALMIFGLLCCVNMAPILFEFLIILFYMKLVFHLFSSQSGPITAPLGLLFHSHPRKQTWKQFSSSLIALITVSFNTGALGIKCCSPIFDK